MLSESLGLHSLVLDSFTHTPSYLLVTCISAAFLSLRFIHNFNLVHYLRQHSLGELVLSVTFQTFILTTYALPLLGALIWVPRFLSIIELPSLHEASNISGLVCRSFAPRLCKESWWGSAIQAWLLLELASFVFYKIRIVQLSAPTTPPAFSKEEKRRTVEGVLSWYTTPQAFRNWLSGWFFNSAPCNIWHDNIAEWFAWSFFSKDCSQLTSEERKELEDVLSEFHDRAGLPLQPCAKLHTCHCMRLTLDRVDCLHRPFVLYLIFALLHCIMHAACLMWGFRKMRTSAFEYWYRPAKVPTTESQPQSHQRPIVFVHGMVGLFPCIRLVHTLIHAVGSSRPIFLIEIPHISIRMYTTIPTATQVVQSIGSMLNRHGFQKATFGGHSFGTLYVTWVLKKAPHLVENAVMADPISFLLCQADVAYNFVYRQPRTFEQWVLRYFAATELNVAFTLSRHFWWYENALWPDEVGDKPLTVLLGGHDTIVPAQVVQSYVEKKIPHAQVHFFDAYPHAAVVVLPRGINAIVNALMRPPV